MHADQDGQRHLAVAITPKSEEIARLQQTIVQLEADRQLLQKAIAADLGRQGDCDTTVILYIQLS